MSFGVDVNILLYASDDSSPLHDKAKAFLLQTVTDGARVRWLRRGARRADAGAGGEAQQQTRGQT